MNYFKGRHFQQDIIIVAVGYYFRFSLSYRDIVELLRDRGLVCITPRSCVGFIIMVPSLRLYGANIKPPIPKVGG